jgi:hypothetical protein
LRILGLLEEKEVDYFEAIDVEDEEQLLEGLFVKEGSLKLADNLHVVGSVSILVILDDEFLYRHPLLCLLQLERAVFVEFVLPALVLRGIVAQGGVELDNVEVSLCQG